MRCRLAPSRRTNDYRLLHSLVQPNGLDLAPETLYQPDLADTPGPQRGASVPDSRTGGWRAISATSHERGAAMVTRAVVVDKLHSYLRGEAELDEIVDWAEDAIAEADFDAVDGDALRDAVARLGLADVKAFGLTWENVRQILSQLGYRTRIELESAP